MPERVHYGAGETADPKVQGSQDNNAAPLKLHLHSPPRLPRCLAGSVCVCVWGSLTGPSLSAVKLTSEGHWQTDMLKNARSVVVFLVLLYFVILGGTKIYSQHASGGMNEPYHLFSSPLALRAEPPYLHETRLHHGCLEWARPQAYQIPRRSSDIFGNKTCTKKTYAFISSYTP